MALLRLHEVITKVYDLLRQDSRTAGVDWFNGRRSPAQWQQSPAGDVYLGPGTVLPYTIPSGEHGRMQVVVEVGVASHAGSGPAEVALRGLVDSVAEVLLDNWELGLAYAYPEGLTWDASSEPEASPAYASARMQLAVRILPEGS